MCISACLKSAILFKLKKFDIKRKLFEARGGDVHRNVKEDLMERGNKFVQRKKNAKKDRRLVDKEEVDTRRGEKCVEVDGIISILT